MANNSFELSQPSIEQLNKSLDKLVGSMNALEKRLASLQKGSQTAFERVFGSQKDFDAIIRSINKLNATGVDGLKSLTSSIKSLANSVADLPAKAPTQFFNSLTKILETVSSTKFKSSSDFVNFIKSLSTVVSTLNAAGGVSKGAQETLRAIAAAIKIAASLAADSDVKAITTKTVSQLERIKIIALTIKAIVVAFSEIQPLPPNILQTLRQISSAVSVVRNLAKDKDAEQLSHDQINQLNAISRLVQTLQKVIGALGQFGRIDPNVVVNLRQFSILGRAIGEMGRGIKFLLESLGQISVGNILKIGATVAALAVQFKGVTVLLQATGGLKDTAVLGKIFDQFGFGLLSLTRAADQIDVKQVAKIGLIVSALAGAFQSAAKILSSVSGFEQLAKLTSILSSLVTSISFFAKFADTINIVKTITIALKLRTFFNALGGALASAANNVAKTQGLENLTKLAEIFARLGPAITSILKVAEKLPLFNPVKIIKQFLQIRALVSTVSQIAGGLAKSANKLAGNNGLANLDQLSVIFDRLGRGIRSLIGAAGVVEKAKLINLNPVKELFKSLDPLFKQLRKFKNATLPDFGAIFESLFKFASDSADAKFDKTTLKEFQGFTKELAKGLNELGKVRVDTKKLDAIGVLLGNISGLKGDLSSFSSGGVTGGVGIPLGRELSDEVEEGFLSGQIRLKLFGILVNAFKALNPITLTRDFVTGLVSVFTKLASLPDAFINKIKEAGSSLQSLGSSLKSSGLALINGVGLGGIANNSFFQAAVGFDDLSTQVQNFGNLTDEQLKSAQAFSNEIGVKYPQSSNEALQATLNLLKAGLQLNDTFTALPAAADLSAISDTHNLDEASKALILVTQSFKDFNDETVASFDNSSVAADIIARAANNSTASVESLVEGLKNVGPVANAAGLSLEETTAILGLFSDAGIAGAEGGTQLKSLLTNITRSTPQVTGELRKLGVSLKDAEGNFRPINDVINDLSRALFETKNVTISVGGAFDKNNPRLAAAQKAYASAARQLLLYNDGLTTGALDQEKANKKIGELSAVQANAMQVIQEITGSQATAEQITAQITRGQFENFQSIQKLAGSFGQAGLNILLSQGTDAIAGFIDEMNHLPTAAEQAQALLDNLRGDVTQLQGSVESLGTRAFLPLINRVFRPLVKIGRLVADFFGSLPDPILETIVNAGVLVSIIATLAGGFLVAAGFITQFSGIILTVVGTIGGLVVNIPLVVAALSGFVAAFASLVTLGAILAPILLSISSVITTFFRVLENNVGGAGSALSSVQETVSKLAESIGEIFSIGGDILNTIFGNGLNEQNVELGERVAAFFSDINDQVLILKEKVQVIRDFFKGFQAFLGFDGNEEKKRAELIAKFTKEMPGAPEVVILGRVNEELERSKKTLNTLATSLAGSSIFNSFFGRSGDTQFTPDDILKIFGSIQTTLIKARNGLFGALGAGKNLLLDALGITKLNPKQLSQAQSDLSRNLSTIGGLVTKLLGNITGIDFTDTLASFDENDFKAGAESLIKSLFEAIKTVFFNNQDKITDILAGVFNFLLPGKFVVPILRFFGLDTVADSIQKIFDDINKLFRSSLGFIFDILKGKSLNDALFGNFGTAAKPISRLITAIGKAFGTLVGIFEDLFKVLFPGGLGAGGGGSFIESVIDGIASAFEVFTSVILQPIRVVLPQLIQVLGSLGKAAVTILGGLFDLISKVAGPLTKLFSDLFSGKIDLGGFLAQIGPAILNTLTNLVTELPNLLGTILTGIGSLINSPLLEALGEDLQNGDFSGAISTIASAIGDLISGALSSVPGLLTDLGTTLGSPLLTKIGEALSQGDVLGAIQSITDSIANTIKDAITGVPDRLIELGTTLDLSFLKDLGLTLSQSEIFQKFIDALSNLAALPIEAFSSVVDAVKSLVGVIGDLAKNDPVKLLGITAVIGTFLAILAGPALLAGITALAAPLAALIVPALGVISILLLLKNGLTAVADVISGKKNVFEGISEFFTGLASDALSLIGIEITPQEIADRITTFFNSVNGIIQVFISQALNSLKTAVQNIIDTILGSIDDAKARVDQSAVGQHTGFGDLFFQLQQSVKDNNFRAISQTLADAAEKGLDLEPFQRALRNNFSGVMETFEKDLPNLFDFAPDDFAAVVNTLVNANALDDAAALVPPEKLKEFYQKLFAVDPSKLVGLDFSTIQGTLSSALASGIFDLSDVTNFVLKLPNLTDEQKKTIIDGFKAQITPTTPVAVGVQVTVQPKPTTPTPSEAEQFQKILKDNFPGVEVKVPVTPSVEPKPLTPEESKAIVDQTTQALVPTGGDVPQVAVPVEVAAVTDPETAQAFADTLATVTTNADLAKASLTELQAQTALISTDLSTASLTVAQYALDVDTNTTLAETSWIEHEALVNPLLIRIGQSLAGIVGRFQDITGRVNEANATYPKKLTSIGSAFATMVNTAIGPLDRLNSRLRDINFILQQIIANLGTITGGTGNPDDINIPGRAGGGDVFAGRLYEVAERGISELLKIGDKTFLIPGQNGTVIPPTTATGFTPPPAVANTRNVSNNNVISVDAPIHIELAVPGNPNVEQIAEAVAKRVQPLGGNIAVDVQRALRLAGSSGA